MRDGYDVADYGEGRGEQERQGEGVGGRRVLAPHQDEVERQDERDQGQEHANDQPAALKVFSKRTKLNSHKSHTIYFFNPSTHPPLCRPAPSASGAPRGPASA